MGTGRLEAGGGALTDSASFVPFSGRRRAYTCTRLALARLLIGVALLLLLPCERLGEAGGEESSIRESRGKWCGTGQWPLMKFTYISREQLPCYDSVNKDEARGRVMRRPHPPVGEDVARRTVLRVDP
eukprot:scaffold1318_cov388-Prasinococcus_capsulatus_cf.AAC.43